MWFKKSFPHILLIINSSIPASNNHSVSLLVDYFTFYLYYTSTFYDTINPVGTAGGVISPPLGGGGVVPEPEPEVLTVS
ncbi:MAG: hypothetical protein UV60_C0005G0001 [Parcubacteria group bacterium GW2011_GWA2_43_11]|nr:MAG: hypothetical protein UV60_C0005G0001 [Parcubacteria group bacterium GW2011_GWA2_43_11]